MKLVVLLLACVFGVFARQHGQHPIFGDREVRASSFFRRALDCRPEGHACSGLPKCCGDLHCYWEDGYSPLSDGECVVCIEDGQICQRDAQCCGGLVCQKARAIHKDGVCGQKRAAGEPCHEDDQCQSGDCGQKWYQFSEGECN